MPAPPMAQRGADLMWRCAFELQRYCESEEGMAFFTKYAIQYAMEDQEEEWRAEFEGRVRVAHSATVTLRHRLPRHTPVGYCAQSPGFTTFT